MLTTDQKLKMLKQAIETLADSVKAELKGLKQTGKKQGLEMVVMKNKVEGMEARIEELGASGLGQAAAQESLSTLVQAK